MSETNLYWNLRGNYEARKKKLSSFSKKFLEDAILDQEYNNFLRDWADYKDDDTAKNTHGKRLPYIGWYWRHLNFSSGSLPIGNCGSFIGFIANNKWNYNERLTTPEEFSAIMAIIDEAMRLSTEGGILSKIVERTEEKISELWPLLQTMKVDYRP